MLRMPKSWTIYRNLQGVLQLFEHAVNHKPSPQQAESIGTPHKCYDLLQMLRLSQLTSTWPDLVRKARLDQHASKATEAHGNDFE